VVVSRIHSLPQLEIAAQGRRDGGMKGQQTRFAKFRVLDPQHAVRQDISEMKIECLRDPKPRCGDEADQGAVHRAAQTIRLAEATGGVQEAHHLFE
jgi:hypothetical protein